MSQLYLKGVYYDAGDAGGLWFKNDSGSYEEVSAGGVTIYTGDGSLSGDRSVDLNGHQLNFSSGATTLSIDPIGFEGRFIANDGTGYGGVIFTGNSVGTDVTFKIITNITPNDDVYIEGNAITQEIEYSADTHTFNVGITITELAGVGTRAIAVDANGKIVLL